MVFSCQCFSFLFEEENQDIEKETRIQRKPTLTESLFQKPSNLRVFTVDELKAATNNFCRDWRIGEGGSGSFYRGVIKSLEDPSHEIQVAVKYVNGLFQEHGQKEWVTKVKAVGFIEHPNIVKLVGYCIEDIEGQAYRLLVYEYMPNGTLRDHLCTKSKTPLSFTMRLKVAQDVARGLGYLLEEMNFEIISGDIQFSKVLLDDECNAKLAGFGLARLSHQGLTHVSTKVEMEYMAPEYMTGHLSANSYIWSYGVFLCELITGRLPLDRNRPYFEQKLVEWVKPHLDPTSCEVIIDPSLKCNYSLKLAQKLSIIASRCLSTNPMLRPKMSEVLEMVNELIGVSQQATTPEMMWVQVVKKVLMCAPICKKTRKPQCEKGSISL